MTGMSQVLNTALVKFKLSNISSELTIGFCYRGRKARKRLVDDNGEIEMVLNKAISRSNVSKTSILFTLVGVSLGIHLSNCGSDPFTSN